MLSFIINNILCLMFICIETESFSINATTSRFISILFKIMDRFININFDY